jgi:glycosyltransferase involved in cell wall biosynthesis
MVAVQSDAAADLLGDGRGGILTPEELVAFASSVVELWKQPERRRAMGVAGRQIAEAYAPDTCAAKLLGLYEELVRVARAVPAHARAARLREA